jgi:SAM-dependent methyltransferase
VDDPARRAASFAAVADAYERARPEYPRAAVEWLVEDARVVVDLGAGTGKLTRGLTALGRDVVAVEPLPAMAARLRQALPAARVLSGSAEAIPLGDGSADAVVAGQAFHWFDPIRALPEIARVLRPGGALGLVWNTRDDAEPWVARLSVAIGSEAWQAEPDEAIEASGRFGTVRGATFRHEQRLDRAGLLDLVRSRSRLAVLDEEQRAPVLQAVAQLYDEFAGDDGIVLPYVTRTFRAERL